MRNIKIIIEYDGTDFYGWQTQPHKRTVQGEIKNAIKKITGEDVRIIGAARTDKGVHAVGQVANFFLKKEIKNDELKKGLNAVLPEDIYIKELEEVYEDFHSRFYAKSRLYKYFIFCGKSPLRRRFSWEFERFIEIDKANEIASLFLKEADFKYLSTKDEGLCNVLVSRFYKDNEYIVYEIEANRFLRRMVRHILGVIISVYLGKFNILHIDDIFKGRKKCLLLPPPQGLYLWEVKY
uniref:tRNA pseudouridine synthase A n=1 Tax=candidate division WOR-3 bacterium TaxID=2052148 RepID=A0A7C4YRJ5_UNCW3